MTRGLVYVSGIYSASNEVFRALQGFSRQYPKVTYEIHTAAEYLNPAQIVFRPFAGEITTNTVLVWRKYGMSFGVASAFWAYIKQAGLRQE